jgi:competence protein ComEA
MEKMNKNKVSYIFIVVIVIGFFGGWYYLTQNKGLELEITGEKMTELKNETIEEIMVDVTGEVNEPGVVILAQDARLVEVIEAAGGFTENADQDAVNLARKIKDEEKIVIPEMGEKSQNNSNHENALININTASAEELNTLPGIGDAIAQGIINYREKNGSFTELEQLKNVSRIGDKLFEGLSQYITF